MRLSPNQSKPALPLTSSPAAVGSRVTVWLVAAMLVLVTVAVFWPATRYGFINLDDPDFVSANPHVQGGLTWAGVKWAFSDTQQAAYWAPVLWWSHLLTCQIFGMNPWGHHLINVLLHAANTALVFLVFRRLTGATWRSVMLAAFFGWHPLRVESVVWVTERKDVLSTLFWLLTMWAYARHAQKAENGKQKAEMEEHSPFSIFHLPSSCFYWVSLICFALGLMSKSMLVTLPFVLLLLDYWPLKRISDFRFSISDGKQLLVEKIPFFALAAGASVVTFLAQQGVGAVMAAEKLSLGARGANALISYCRYLGNLFWPTQLAVFYPHPGHWPLAEVLLAVALLAGITALVLTRRRHPFLPVGWLWFVGTLVPVIGMVQVGDQAMADRYSYIPSLGVLILVIWGAYEFARRWRRGVMALSVVGGAAIIVYAGLTRQQMAYWQDSETLFRHALAVTKNNHIAHNGLGIAAAEKGRIDEAIRQLQEAIRLAPDYADAHYNLAEAFRRNGQSDEAIRQYQETIRLKPNKAEAHYNLGEALGRKKLLDAAISQYQEAIRLKPDYGDAHYNLGNALLKRGQTDAAISHFQAAIRSSPENAEAFNNLGIALLNQGRTDMAISQFQAALRVSPDNAEVHNNFGAALLKQGWIDAAIGQFQEAVRLNPNFAGARNNLVRAQEMKNAPAGR